MFYKLVLFIPEAQACKKMVIINTTKCHVFYVFFVIFYWGQFDFSDEKNALLRPQNAYGSTCINAISHFVQGSQFHLLTNATLFLAENKLSK